MSNISIRHHPANGPVVAGDGSDIIGGIWQTMCNICIFIRSPDWLGDEKSIFVMNQSWVDTVRTTTFTLFGVIRLHPPTQMSLWKLRDQHAALAAFCVANY